jgi:preprotein translocase subunit SecD
MKRIFLIVITGIVLFALSSCSGAPKTKTVSSQGKQTAAAQYKVAADVCFREGTAADGKVVLSSADIIGFHTGYDNYHNSYNVIFQLTESGKKTFAEETEKMLGRVISVWAGKECLRSPYVEAQITDGSVAIPVEDESSMTRICGKLKGSADSKE